MKSSCFADFQLLFPGSIPDPRYSGLLTTVVARVSAILPRPPCEKERVRARTFVHYNHRRRRRCRRLELPILPVEKKRQFTAGFAPKTVGKMKGDAWRILAQGFRGCFRREPSD